MREFMTITKALSDGNRVRTLMFLRNGELCVCQIIEILQLAPSTVSKHMNILYHAGLVEMRKESRWIYYRLPEHPDPVVRDTLEWLSRTLAKDEQVRDDAQRCKRVKKIAKEKLCERYSRC